MSLEGGREGVRGEGEGERKRKKERKREREREESLKFCKEILPVLISAW